MFKFWKKKTKIGPVITKAEVKVLDEFPFVEDKKDVIEALIKMHLKGYHLHKSPPKGVKRIPKIKVTD